MNKKILVTQSSMPPLEEYMEEIKSVWDSKWLTNMGEKHKKLEAELAAFCDVPNIALFTNGHLALELSIQALNLQGEVITTPYTFISTTHAITRNGLTPVFCDIDPSTYTIDVSKIEALITEKTSAILPVHVYGNICDVEAIDAIAKKHNLKVLYDAAHTFGETYKGKSVAQFGDASMFSFHATKVFHTIEGGAVATKNEALYHRLNKLKNFGILNETTIDEVGGNAKMNEFQAAMGICNLRHLREEIRLRKAVVERYRENLSGINGLILNRQQPEVESNYAYFPVIFEKEILGIDRDTVYDALKTQGIFSRKYFYPTTNSCGCYRGHLDPGITPVADHMAASVLTLPLYAHLPLETVDRICDAIRTIIKL